MDTRPNHQVGSSVSQWREWLGPALLAALFLTLSAWTWRKWPDLLVDFGRELYVPWQLLAGKVLYRDIAHLNGPLSPYLNALWFCIFGVSLTTLIIINLVLTALVTTAIFFLIKHSCDRLTATCSCMVFLCITAFAHFTFTGNYNFVCPYSHELTHGIALSILMILFMTGSIDSHELARGNLSSEHCEPGTRSRVREAGYPLAGVPLIDSHGQPGMLLAAGFCLGLVFLTKAEVFLAALAAALVGMVLTVGTQRRSGGRAIVLLCAFWAAAFLPAAFFLAYLVCFMPIAEALRGIAGAWQHVFTASLLGSAFYRESLGISDPGTHLWTMARSICGLLFFTGSLVACSLTATKPTTKFLLMLSSLVLLALSLLVKISPIPLLLVPEPLPLITCLGGVALFVHCVKNRREPQAIARLAPLCLWAVFAFFLLGKLMLNPRFYHYGFGLAMPGAIFLVVVLVRSLPSFASTLHGRAQLLRVLVVGILAADLGYYVLLSNIAYSQKTYAVGAGPDFMLTYEPSIDPRGPAVRQLLDQIEHRFPSRATFVALPEGVMINYLSRRPNPTPYINFMPTELSTFGEASMLKTFQSHPPDFIILVEKDTSEYGVGPFGVDPGYGMLIVDWVGNHYETVWQVVGQPLTEHHFGISILKPRTRSITGN